MIKISLIYSPLLWFIERIIFKRPYLASNFFRFFSTKQKKKTFYFFYVLFNVHFEFFKSLYLIFSFWDWVDSILLFLLWNFLNTNSLSIYYTSWDMILVNLLILIILFFNNNPFDPSFTSYFYHSIIQYYKISPFLHHISHFLDLLYFSLFYYLLLLHFFQRFQIHY